MAGDGDVFLRLLELEGVDLVEGAVGRRTTPSFSDVNSSGSAIGTTTAPAARRRR